MNGPRKVLLIVDAEAPAPAAAELADALRELGAEVRAQALAAPYDELLDALADGWLPVYLGQGAAASASAAPPA